MPYVFSCHFDKKLNPSLILFASRRGLSGEVNKVYTSDKADLQFGHFQQPNAGIITLDRSTLSRHSGTEVSGLLGFQVLRLLEVKLDYRDGLVDFEYDSKRVKASVQ